MDAGTQKQPKYLVLGGLVNVFLKFSMDFAEKLNFVQENLIKTTNFWSYDFNLPFLRAKFLFLGQIFLTSIIFKTIIIDRRSLSVFTT